MPECRVEVYKEEETHCPCGELETERHLMLEEFCSLVTVRRPKHCQSAHALFGVIHTNITIIS